MPNGSFDHSLARPFDEVVERAKGPADTDRLARLRFHLDNGDYFAYLATIFGFLEENLDGHQDDVINEELAFVRTVRKDLVYLQNEYRIDPRTLEA